MCDPVLVIGVIALVVSVAGTVISVQGQRAAAKTAVELADRNAELADYQADDRIRQGKEEVRNRRLRTISHIKSQRAALAANGVMINDGTAFDLQVQTAYYGEIDAISIGHQARVEATYLRNGAIVERFQGRATAAQHRNAALATGLQGAGSALNIASSLDFSSLTTPGGLTGKQNAAIESTSRTFGEAQV